MTTALAALERVGENRSLEQALSFTRLAQRNWSESPIGFRTAVLKRFRHAVAADPKILASAIQQVRQHSSAAEILSSEILPLLDACKFAEKNTAELLRSVKLRRKERPFWLAGTSLELRREPFGTVLIIAPGNYPLFLAGVQTLQALVTGNAVLLKPAPGASLVIQRFRQLLVDSGLDATLLDVIEEDPESAHRAMECGVDKIVLTGSEATGRDVLRRASDTITPVTCELSGCDAMVVLPGADLDLAANALRFGLRLNASQTCMRPHRVFVHADVASDFKRRTIEVTQDLRIPLTHSAVSQLINLLQRSPKSGVTQIAGSIFDDYSASPHILENGDSTAEIWQSDIFAPVLVFRSFTSEQDLMEHINACRYGLGVCIFSPSNPARRLSARLKAGFVLVNDVIVPTADPRFPFSGRKRSGFGVTRGAEGLLEFTQVKAVSIRRSGHPHFEDERAADEHLFAGAIAAAHGGTLRTKVKGAINAFRAARDRMQIGKRAS